MGKFDFTKLDAIIFGLTVEVCNPDLLKVEFKMVQFSNGWALTLAIGLQ